MKNNSTCSKTSLLKTVLFLFLFIGLTTQAQTWKTPLASGGTYITTQINDVFFVSATKGWAVGDSGLIMTTNDGGDTWIQQTSGTTAFLFSVHFTSATNGFAAGANGLILTTTDGGTTWTIRGVGISVQLNSIFFVSPTKGWVCGANGAIYNTNDSGVSWTQQTTGTSNSFEAVHFTSPTNGVMLSTGIAAIYTTTDGGATWTANTTTIGTTQSLYDVSFVSPTQGWAVGRSGTIITTTDGGANWTAQTSGTSNHLYGVHFTSASVGCAVGTGGIILTTTNGGVSWTPQTSGTANQLNSVCFATATTAITVGTVGTAIKTTDSGTSWTNKLGGTTNVLNAVSFASATHGWAVGNGGTILATTNGGKDWTAQTSGTALPLNSVSFVSATQGWAVGNFGIILATIDGGVTWTAQNSGTTNVISAVSFVSATQGWAVLNVNSNTVLTTNDGGTTWTTQTFDGTGVGSKSVHFISATHGWAILNATTSNLIRTTDGGASWTRNTAAAGAALEDVFFISATKGWVINTQGAIRTTNDGGVTWTNQTSGLSATTGGNLYFTSATNGWATNSSGKIVTTTDGGATWTSQAIGLGVIKGIHFVTDNFGVAVGNTGAIYLNETIVADTTPPTVAITSTASGTTSLTTIPVTVTFSESVTGFVAGDITVSNGTVSGFAGSGTTYTFNIIPTTSGAITVNIAAGVAQDDAANGNTVATQFSITYCATPTAYNVTGTGPYCSGGTGVTVGLSNSETGVNYQLKKDGTNYGEAVAGTGSTISFGNQTNATYTVLATRTTSGCTATMTGTAVVTVTTSTTNTTTASACDSYTWSVNGQTYTTSGLYTGTTTNCVTEKLDLTITPSSSHTTPITANNTYTWSVNGQTYTASGTYTGTTTNCVTEKLDLTIVHIATTKVKDAQCNTILATPTTVIAANPITGAEGYKFEVSEYNGDTIGAVIDNVTTTATYFRLSQLSTGIVYNKKYSVRVAILKGGIYGDFGAACPITASAAPLTKLTDALCNTILASTTTAVTATAVTGAQGYKFEVSEYIGNAINPTFLENVETTGTYFRLTQLTAGTTYNKKYAIRVAGKFNGEYANLGASCNVTTPAPTSKIKAAQCGVTLAALNTAVACDAVTGAQGYMFEVKENNVVVGEIATTTAYFRLTQLSGGTANGKTYAIAVAVKFNGTYGEYNEAAACTVYTPSGKKMDSAKGNTEETSKAVTDETSDAVAKVITLKAYPNPFVSTFRLGYTPLTLENVTIRVYDMTGRQVETRVFEANQANDQEFGTQYATGIYNVNIAQGNNIQNIRVIKN